MKKCFFILFSFFLLSNNFAFASEPEESYEEEEDEEETEETESAESEEESSESSGDEESQNNPTEVPVNQANNEMMSALEQAQIIQENKQQVRQTVDDVLGINRNALSAKQQKKNQQENQKVKKEVEKLRNEVSELKKLSKESQRKERDTQRLLNRLQKELAEREKEPREETPKPKPKPKKKPAPKKKVTKKPTKQKKIYTVKKDRLPEYENYLKDFMPNYLNTSQQSASKKYDINSILKQSQMQYPTRQYGKSSAVDYWNPSSFGVKNRVTVLKDNGINRYTVKSSLPSAASSKPQSTVSEAPHPIGVEEMKNLYGNKNSKKTYFKGKCSCKNKNKQSESGGFFENFNLFG